MSLNKQTHQLPIQSDRLCILHKVEFSVKVKRLRQITTRSFVVSLFQSHNNKRSL